MTGEDKLRVWLEIDQQGFVHGGELLRTVVNIESPRAGETLLLATMQIKMELETLDRNFSPAKIKSFVDTHIGHDTIYGGGHLSKGLNIIKHEGGKLFLCFYTPPSIVAANVGLKEGLIHAYEWIIRLPPTSFPSIRGETLSFSYSVTSGLQFKGRPSMILEKPFTTLPAFSHKPDAEHELEVPFCFFRLDQSVAHLQNDSFPYTRCIAPDLEVKDSVWDRYKRNIPPKLEDFTRFRLHPLLDGINRLQGADESHPSMASLFNSVVLDSGPLSFNLRSGTEVVVEIKISRGTIRLGEELLITQKFPPCSILSLFQMSAVLVCVETIKQEYALPEAVTRKTRIFRSKEASCWMHKQLSFSISLPSDANPTLFTNFIDISWHIDFIFVCGANRRGSLGPPTGSPLLSSNPSGTAGKSLMQCTIPIKVVPSLAVNLALNRASLSFN